MTAIMAAPRGALAAAASHTSRSRLDSVRCRVKLFNPLEKKKTAGVSKPKLTGGKAGTISFGKKPTAKTKEGGGGRGSGSGGGALSGVFDFLGKSSSSATSAAVKMKGAKASSIFSGKARKTLGVAGTQLKKAGVTQKKPGFPFGLGGGSTPDSATAKTIQSNVKMLSRAVKKPSAKPAVTKSSAVPKRSSVGSRQDEKDNVAKWYGPTRALYLPSGLLTKADLPDYLDGTLAGDYGFDPLGLGKDKENVKKLREAELLHARWAMLAVPGVFFPEALGVKGGTWFETGAVMLSGENLTYTAPPLFSAENPLPLPLVVLVQIGLMGLVEKYRSEGTGPEKGWVPVFGGWEDANPFAGLNSINPGGPLNPFGAATNSPEDMQLMKEREIKNGRLAMIAMLGVFIQALVTQEGPYANWSKHVADPFGYNLTTLFAGDFTTL